MQVDKWRHNFIKGFVKILLLLTFLLQTFSCTAGVNSDGRALLSFKWSIYSDPYLSLSDWNEWDPTPCNWSGISCLKLDSDKNPRVVSLQLPHKGLAGSIPKELGNLTYLRNIDLQNNQLIGMLHQELFDALFLRNIILSGNQLSGIIPAEVGNLTDLLYLNLGNNHLVGSIPDTVTNCASLVSLVLKENAFTGSIPYGMGSNLTLLQQLDLSSNRLTGSIPADLGDLSHLQGTLNLSYNHLSGLIPATLGKVPLNVSLDLQQNDLRGPIPQTGRFAIQGPSAFLGNSGLCGFPLKVECPSFPSEPWNLSPGLAATGSPGATVVIQGYESKSLGIKQTVAIAVGDVFGIAVISLSFIYCYMRHTFRKAKKNARTFSERNSFRYYGSSPREGPEGNSIATDPADLVRFSKDFNFELDDLLKASAYVLGKCGSGVVYKAILEGGTTVAVRSLGIEGVQYHKEIGNQLQIMGQVFHPNVVRLRAYFWSVQEKLLVYDFKSGGNLLAALQACRTAKGPLPWATRLNIAKGAARGLAYLHDCGFGKYVHGDIKPSKILLDENMEACIADFNLGKLQSLCDVVCDGMLVPGSRTCSNIRETAIDELQLFRSSPYQPPDASKNLRPTQKWDVYAFGVILLELLTGRSLPAKLAASESDLVTWVHTSSQGSKSFSKVLDPLLLERMHVQHEMLEVLQIALSCVAIAPEQRPRMKHIAESLGKIGCSSSK
ncbi:hypothetical protein O6H91_09G017000 [Diphasiastrum complanatum]|uniref:Uncharacterized protein n=2 Tax=Diphasiastrum complanatum TaxID=34168 RepID=A0ACC2CMI0_DIPCM|nr:hypothetical protein O6H91_09G017000 [Diphasiastrum complanatum]KAJ7542913.1 hypothetical protein O6H91_09G017000 [Diphasiastrum complanatum]